MKMRKKLAALLAAAMIASVMPMTAFAASTNRVTQVAVVGDGKGTDKPVLKMELKDGLKQNDKFYLKLENAEWDAYGEATFVTGSAVGATASDRLMIKKISDTEAEVYVIGTAIGVKDIEIDLVTKNIKGEAKVKINAWDAAVTEGEYLFAKASTAKSIVTVGDAPSFYVDTNKIAEFVIEEATIGAISKNNKVEFILDSDDFIFDETAIATYSKGLTGSGATAVYGGTAKNPDKQKLIVTLDGTNSNARGVAKVQLKVKNAVKRPATGDLNVEISGDLVESKSYKVATIAEHGVSLKAEKDDYTSLAGRQKEVEFNLNEIVSDSMVFGGRETEFSLPEGVYFNAKPTIEKSDTKTADEPTIDPVTNDDGQITGFRVKLTSGKTKFKAKLDITSNFEGDIVLKAEGRSIGQDLETVLAKVTPAVKVTVEPMTVKVGMKEQVGGKIVIEELEKGALQQGNIFVALEKEAGVYITGADVKVVEGDLKLGDLDKGKTTKEAITVNVNRKSRTASTIELTNIKVKLDRTVPEGAYELNVGGTAVSEIAKQDGKGIYGYDNIVAKDFLYVGEKYTKAEVVFNIGSAKFTVNGKEMTMDAAAYVKDGRTMVPVRYLSYALGINEDSIKFSNGVVTIFTLDGKVIQVKNNDKNLVVNGMSVGMVAAAEIKEGRTYVPVTEIGSVFGVTGTWDAASQTATFK